MSEREQELRSESAEALAAEVVRLRARLAAVEAELTAFKHALTAEKEISERVCGDLRAERDEAQRALEAVLPWFEDADYEGPADTLEMAQMLRAALPVPARTGETTR